MAGTRKDPRYLEYAATADSIYDTCLQFEVTRRRIYKHLNWVYLLDAPERSRRSDGLYWIEVQGECKHCNLQYTRLSRVGYFMWHAYLPFLCKHKMVVTNLRVEPDKEIATKNPEIQLPPEVKVVNPVGASVSSGGVVTSAKLKLDVTRVNRDASKAVQELKKGCKFTRDNPVPTDLFLELEESVLIDKIATIENQQAELISALETQIVANIVGK